MHFKYVPETVCPNFQEKCLSLFEETEQDSSTTECDGEKSSPAVNESSETDTASTGEC